MRGLEISVLGPLAVRRDGQSVRLESVLARRLVVLLALERGAPLPDGVIVDRLWPGDVPPTAIQSLRNTVARARKVLGADAVERVGGGYRLVIQWRGLDVEDLELRVEEARRLLAVGQPFDAVEQLGEARRSMRRGDLLADVAEEVWAAPDVARIGELVAMAEELWGEGMICAGRHQEVVPELARAAREQPLREQRWGQLMVALARDGRQTEALRAFQEARSILSEAGIDPCPSLCALEKRVLAQDPTLLESSSSSSAAGVARLPLYLSPFMGREDLLDTVRDRVAHHRLVTLSGPGGVGKTRLAVEAASSVAARYPGGTPFVDLTVAVNGDVVPYVLGSALGLMAEGDVTGGGDPVERVIVALQARRCLVILDNAEHVLAAARRVTLSILHRCPGVSVLVTSRMLLDVPGEAHVVVGPLPLPDLSAKPEVLMTVPSVALFRALSADAASPLDEGELRATAEVVASLDGLPLAIELAARLTRSLAPVHIASELTRRRALLDLTDGRGPPRHRSIRSVLDWSHELLEPEDRKVFRRLGAFAAPFTLESAERIAALDDGGGNVTSSLARLVDASLLVVERSSPSRYRLLDVYRHYARERLEEAGEAPEVEDRLVSWYVEFAEREAPRVLGPGQRSATALLRAELDNLRDLLRRLPGVDSRAALRISGALTEFWLIAGLCAEGPEWMTRALDGAPPTATPERVRALLGRGRATGTYGGLARQLPGIEEAAELALSLGDRELVAFAHLWLCVARAWSRDDKGAAEAFVTAHEAAGELPWVKLMLQFYSGLGAGRRGDLTRAQASVRSAVQGLVHLGDQATAASMLLHLGMLEQRQGRVDDARRDLEDSLRLARGLDMPVLEAHARYTQGLIAIDGSESSAFEQVSRSREELEALGDIGCVNGCNRVLAGLLLERGDVGEALQHLRERLDTVADWDDQEFGLSLLEIACAYHQQHRTDEAGRLVATAEVLFTGSGIGLGPREHARLAEVRRTIEEALAAEASVPDRSDRVLGKQDAVALARA